MGSIFPIAWSPVISKSQDSMALSLRGAGLSGWRPPPRGRGVYLRERASWSWRVAVRTNSKLGPPHVLCNRPQNRAIFPGWYLATATNLASIVEVLREADVPTERTEVHQYPSIPQHGVVRASGGCA